MYCLMLKIPGTFESRWRDHLSHFLSPSHNFCNGFLSLYAYVIHLTISYIDTLLPFRLNLLNDKYITLEFTCWSWDITQLITFILLKSPKMLQVVKQYNFISTYMKTPFVLVSIVNTDSYYGFSAYLLL